MNARISSVSTFSQIAREHFEKFLECESELNIIKSKANDDTLDDSQNKILKLENLMGKYGVVVVVFAGITLEAYIYDYAARNLGDSFVRKYIDKLDLISKWVLVPKLVTSQEIQRDDRGFQLLVQLVKRRNNIVHNKSVSLSPGRIDEILENYKDEYTKFPDVVREAIEVLDILAKIMESLDPDELASIRLGSG